MVALVGSGIPDGLLNLSSSTLTRIIKVFYVSNGGDTLTHYLHNDQTWNNNLICFSEEERIVLVYSDNHLIVSLFSIIFSNGERIL